MSANSLALIGLAIMVGSLTGVWPGTRRRMKFLLFALYFTGAVAVLVFMAAPRMTLTFDVFAVVGPGCVTDRADRGAAFRIARKWRFVR
jgi:hypothetical protein